MGELPADEVEVVGGVAEGVDDAAVPAGQTGAGPDRGGSARAPGRVSIVLIVTTCTMRSILAITSASAYTAGPGSIRIVEVVGLEERDHLVGGLHRLVPVPPAADDEGGALFGHMPSLHHASGLRRTPGARADQPHPSRSAPRSPGPSTSAGAGPRGVHRRQRLRRGRDRADPRCRPDRRAGGRTGRRTPCAPGITTDELDAIGHDFLIANDAYPSTLGYRTYTESVVTSVNEVDLPRHPG